MKKLTVNEIIKNEGIMLHKNKINVIVAPAGSGKTYYIFNTLLDPTKKSVYLCDTSNLQEAVLKDKNYLDKVSRVDEFKEGFHIDKYNCTVMTYAKWYFEKDKAEYKDIDTIVCDEIHNLFKYKDRFENEEYNNYTKVIENLNDLAKNGKKVVGFTATHDRIKKELDFLLPQDDSKITSASNSNWNIINLSNRTDIKRLRDSFVSAFGDISQINYWFARTNLFKYGKKCLIYTDRVKTAIETENYINNTFKNIKAISLWSKNNKNYPMNEEQLRVRESILSTGIIPNEYNVLIINGAYETGINILDEDIEIAIINNSSADTIIQARSRIRKDIELLLYRVPRAEKADMPKVIVPEEYLDRKLSKEDKAELIKLLDLRDNRGKLLGWTNFKKVLLYNNYSVIDGWIYEPKKVRCHIIHDNI